MLFDIFLPSFADIVKVIDYEQGMATVLCFQRNCRLESGMYIGKILMGGLNLICPFLMAMFHKDYLFPHGRSARSPLKLVDRFPDHPEIGTLHDNFV